MVLVLPVNLYVGMAAMDDQFSKTTITHIPQGSPLFWVHFVAVIVVVVLLHYGICEIEERFKVTRFRGVFGNPSDPSANSECDFYCYMVQVVSKSLVANKGPFEEYFVNKYPGKVYMVIVSMDLCYLDDLVEVRDEISKLGAKIDSHLAFEESGDGEDGRELNGGFWKKVRSLWEKLLEKLGFKDEKRMRRFQEFRDDLETQVAAYKEGRGPGAGVAFVVFRDVYTANKAVKDLRTERRSRIGRFFSLIELQLEMNQWSGTSAFGQ